MPEEMLARSELLWARCQRITRINVCMTALFAATFVVIVVLVAGGAQSATSPSVLVAQEVRIVDQKGNVRAILGLGKSVDQAGHVRLSLQDESGRGRLELITNADGQSAVRFLDGQREDRMEILSLPDGRSGLVVTDDQGRECVCARYARRQGRL